jgi:UDP-N-acetylglucosamine:LPS N-acetylglucosamine transferase
MADFPKQVAPMRQRVLAVASGGGHWVQLLRTTGAFEDHDLAFVTTDDGYRQDVPGSRFYVVNDANRWDRIGSLRLAIRILRILRAERPDLVFSTGAAPGCLAIVFGRLMGARTIWLDSIANLERMSLSGRLVRRFADLWLTQWPHLASPSGPEYAGRVF